MEACWMFMYFYCVRIGPEHHFDITVYDQQSKKRKIY